MTTRNMSPKALRRRLDVAQRRLQEAQVILEEVANASMATEDRDPTIISAAHRALGSTTQALVHL